MKKYLSILLTLIIGVSLIGCASNAQDRGTTQSKVIVGEDKAITDEMKEYYTVGEIIEFEENAVHVLTGDIAEVFKVDKHSMTDFYLGETVGVVKLGEDSYKLDRYKIKDFSIRHTNMGQIIETIEGTVKSVDKQFFEINTKDGVMKFNAYKDIYLEIGEKITVEYLEFGDQKGLVQFYNEDSKIDLVVKGINRLDETGIMKVNTVDSNGNEYKVYVLGSTVLNFNHSDLKVEDKITVYPEVIREIYPAEIDPKKIVLIKEEVKIQ
ncbi:hypothetical protein [Anaeromicrobium sediminis]|uniref:DUF5666 domain-containing protein n=1 Tax=Anaeromicrobium sediminis TaxID=1478221 RepID=A0A267MLL8_9FIRM|nr:hypothetical protein [Anaeromicrobium sediminis]PAB60302.1 hypothetical protein CCE28_05235 [Anaeromicrobium sediminis]